MERPLFWHQGLFLQPQHFQLLDRHIQASSTAVLPFLQPHFWGVGRMTVQDAALGSQSLHILDAEFVFPDRTVAQFPGNALLDPRSFGEGAFEGGKPIGAYVGVRKWNSSGENVTVLSSLDNVSEVTTRYAASTEPEEIIDLYQGGPPAQVRTMYLVLKLFWESEIDQLGDYELIPVAMLVRNGEEIGRSGRFFPPCLDVSAVPPCRKLILDIRDQLASRAHQLEAFKRSRGVHTADFGARDMVYLLALRSLNRYVPQLFHLTEAPLSHPWTVYGVLRQIIGELSSFSETVNMLGEEEDGTVLAPAYNHQDLYACFSRAQRLMMRLLDEITAGPEYVFELVYDGTYYASELPPALFEEGQNRFFLVLNAADEYATELQNYAGMAKMGARESLPILIARALPGVKSTLLDAPPQELPRRTGSVYYQIDVSGDLWQQVQRHRNMAVFWDTAPPDLKVELMVAARR